MELFNTFRETVIANESDRTERQIEELKKIREGMKNTSAIDRDIRLLEAGLQGEKNILFELKNANIGMFVLHDLTFKYRDLTAQVDFIVVTKAYVYLIECKNLIGNVGVNRQGEFKRKYNFEGKDIVEAIYSPVIQARRHKEILRKLWLENHSKLEAFLYERNFDRVYKPIVVLANAKGFLNLKHASMDVRQCTMRADQLVEHIKRDISNYDKLLYMSKKNMQELVDSLLKWNIGGNDNFVEKYRVIHKLSDEKTGGKNIESENSSVEENLKDYRKKKAMEMGVPAYYIFTNEELNKILAKRPKTIDELADMKILSSVKLRCHGEEIIALLN